MQNGPSPVKSEYGIIPLLGKKAKTMGLLIFNLQFLIFIEFSS